MSQQMLGFTKHAQEFPSKRPAEARRNDYDEIDEGFNAEELEVQASRCSQCGIPMCSMGCPLSNNIPEWLSAAAEGRMKDAYLLSSDTNTFPEICGRICPQDRLCEGSCVIEKGFGAVTIGSVEKKITDEAFAKGWVKAPVPDIEREEKIAIIGAGPAGLAAAERLRSFGYQVEIFDRYDRSGGLMIYGIPGFKLEKDIVERRSKLLQDAKIKIHLNHDIGKTVSFADLQTKFDSILIATGVYKSRKLQEASQVPRVKALPYLTAYNRLNLGDFNENSMPDQFKVKDKTVVVIGGGDTAMDCVRTSIRAGAKKVICAYRRDEANMPGSAKEVLHAKQEGVQFEWLAAPKNFSVVHDSDGSKKTKVTFSKMKLGFSKFGRKPVVESGEPDFSIDADVVIEALGFEPENLKEMFPGSGLILNPNGTIEVNPNTMQSSLKNVYAAGDIVRGASLVVWAIRDGRLAADSIHHNLNSSPSSLSKRSL